MARETMELAFLAVVQLLPPRQRATLILRDVLGWSARETAALLETSVASTNSALQRARAALRRHIPERRESGSTAESSEDERALVRRYVDSIERGDFEGFAALLAEDARLLMPPFPVWYQGRDAVVSFLEWFTDAGTSEFGGDFRVIPTGANRQPAVAFYLRRPDDSDYRPFALSVIQVERGAIAEIVSFDADVFPPFDLPPRL